MQCPTCGSEMSCQCVRTRKQNEEMIRAAVLAAPEWPSLTQEILDLPAAEGCNENMVTLLKDYYQFVKEGSSRFHEILSEIKNLASRHGKYGARPEHYAVVGECLLWTLEKGLGEKWNSETKEAWIKVYGVLSEAMMTNQQTAAAAA